MRLGIEDRGSERATWRTDGVKESTIESVWAYSTRRRRAGRGERRSRRRMVPGEVGEGDSIPDGGVDLVRSERESITGAYLDIPVYAHDERRSDESSGDD